MTRACVRLTIIPFFKVLRGLGELFQKFPYRSSYRPRSRALRAPSGFDFVPPVSFLSDTSYRATARNEPSRTAMRHRAKRRWNLGRDSAQDDTGGIRLTIRRIVSAAGVDMTPHTCRAGPWSRRFPERYAVAVRRATTNLAYREPRRPYGRYDKSHPMPRKKRKTSG